MKRLYVGNLDYDVTNEQLKTSFSEIGTVTYAEVVIDRYSGRSKGFGFVEFETEEQADSAIKKLNGTALNKRNIIVSKARPKEERKDFQQENRK